MPAAHASDPCRSLSPPASRQLGWKALLLALIAMGCSATSAEHPFRPTDFAEEDAFAEARRDVFPNDVRANPDEYQGTLLLWSGVVASSAVRRQGRTLVFLGLFEHHYWDWAFEDPERKMAYVSPRGEGFFQCVSPADTQRVEEQVLPVGGFAVVYGTPTAITDKGVVILNCSLVRTGDQTAFSTKRWSYGRPWVLNRDAADHQRIGD